MLLNIIKNYVPYNEQEVKDQQTILRFIEQNSDVLYRTNEIAHITSSAIVVNESMTKVLFAFHNIYQSWSWVGGHNDGEENCLHVALSETKEETGIKNVRPWSDEIFMIDTVYVHNHIKKTNYVPDHLHLNITYLLIADETDELSIKQDENSGVKWFDIPDVLNHVNEERMWSIYQKAFNKIMQIREKGAL
jgi:ADP-ribose pyrophosphatase YjhB (NUDIX family)